MLQPVTLLSLLTDVGPNTMNKSLGALKNNGGTIPGVSRRQMFNFLCINAPNPESSRQFSIPIIYFLFLMMPPAANLQEKKQLRENYFALGIDEPQFLTNQRGNKLMMLLTVAVTVYYRYYINDDKKIFKAEDFYLNSAFQKPILQPCFAGTSNYRSKQPGGKSAAFILPAPMEIEHKEQLKKQEINGNRKTFKF